MAQTKQRTSFSCFIHHRLVGISMLALVSTAFSMGDLASAQAQSFDPLTTSVRIDFSALDGSSPGAPLPVPGADSIIKLQMPGKVMPRSALHVKPIMEPSSTVIIGSEPAMAKSSGPLLRAPKQNGIVSRLTVPAPKPERKATVARAKTSKPKQPTQPQIVEKQEMPKPTMEMAKSEPTVSAPPPPAIAPTPAPVKVAIVPKPAPKPIEVVKVKTTPEPVAPPAPAKVEGPAPEKTKAPEPVKAKVAATPAPPPPAAPSIPPAPATAPELATDFAKAEETATNMPQKLEPAAKKKEGSKPSSASMLTPPQIPSAIAEIPAKPAPKPAEIASKTETGSSMKVVFASNAVKLPGDAKAELKALSQQLDKDKALRLQLLAYAGGKELSASKARRMSLSRALSIRSFLIENGVHSTRIDVRALGNKTTAKPFHRVDVSVVER